jgi:hypothetical protein
MDAQLFLQFAFFLLMTILIETPVLLVGLSQRHSPGRRLFAGVWLNACSYPIVFFVVPQIYDPVNQRVPYLIVAEIFAPVCECFLFWMAFLKDDKSGAGKSAFVRDMATIVIANLASFGLGEVILVRGWLNGMFPGP